MSDDTTYNEAKGFLQQAKESLEAIQSEKEDELGDLQDMDDHDENEAATLQTEIDWIDQVTTSIDNIIEELNG